MYKDTFPSCSAGCMVLPKKMHLAAALRGCQPGDKLTAEPSPDLGYEPLGAEKKCRVAGLTVKKQ